MLVCACEHFKRTTIRKKIGETNYLATWIPLNKMIVLDRNSQHYATISDIPTFEAATDYMERWWSCAPESQAATA